MSVTRPTDAASLRLESYLPESLPLRAVRGFAMVVAAPRWAEAARVLQEQPDLLKSDSLELIDELAETARKCLQPEVADRVQLLLSWVTQHSMAGKAKSSEAFPRIKPPVGSPRLESLLRLTIRVRDMERRLAERPVAYRLRVTQQCWRSILDHRLFPHAPKRWRLDAFNAAGNCSLFGGDRLRDGESLSAAMEFYREALDRAGPESPEQHRYRYNLGRAYYLRCENRLGVAGDLHRAVELISDALAGSPADFRLRPGYVMILAAALDREYLRSGSIEHLERAIRVLEEVLAGPCEESIRGALLSFLGGCYRKRFQRSHDPGDLERAVALTEEAVRLARETDHEARASRYTNLGSALLDWHAVAGGADVLERAIGCFEQAIELTEPGVPGMASRFNNLGNGLSRRAGDGDIAKAVSCYERACELSPPLDHQLASRWFNLANTLAAFPEKQAARRRRNAYRRAIACGLVNSLEWALGAARNWGDWALSRRAWREAARAYRFGLEALERLLQSQFRRSSKEAWLREAPALAGHAAYALARVGRFGSAVAMLERGRARLLLEALERIRSDIDSLQARGHRDLLARFEQAVGRIAELTSEGATAESGTARAIPGIHELREARGAYQRALRAVRRIPGFQRFLVPMQERHIRELASPAPLIYLLATPYGGAALIVRRDRTPTAVELPQLSDTALRSRAELLLRSYWERGNDRPAWLDAVDRCGEWLGQAVFAPISDIIRETGEVVLVPAGLLGVLPFSAGWVASHSGGRDFVLERVRLTHVPNARALGAARAALPPGPIGPVLAVGDPEPGMGSPLPLARYEATVAAGFRQGSTRLLGPEATFDAIDPALSRHGVLHFACHAAASFDEPLKSALYFAGDAALSLRAILDKNLEGVRLALLSACETAAPGLALPDEVVSLPTGLLHAGVPGVVASLWAVGDASTMFLMEAFYRWFPESATPAEALRQAQLELRNATAGELATRAAAIMALPADRRGITYAAASDLWRGLVARPPSSRPYAHPVYWAGFSYYGI